MATERLRRAAGAAGFGTLVAGSVLGLIVTGHAAPQAGDGEQTGNASVQSAGLKPMPARVPKDAGGISQGITACRSCHVAPTSEQAPAFVKKYKSNEFVLLNESTTWDKKDAHSIAYAVLDGKLGQQMTKILGYKVTEAKQCLTCHSVDLNPHKPLRDKTLNDFATNETGVNCTVCHGLGEAWQNDHFREPTKKGEPLPWRTKDPSAKYDRGMHDLRDPMVKARLCATCHVGSPDEGKVVTHEMYAAGHPPLPPFELATFMEGEPKHWGYPTDDRLKFFGTFAENSPSETWPKFHYHPADQEVYLARHLAAGAIAALEAELRLLAVDSHSSLDPKAEAGVDFARFDCFACHHDLKYPSDRQKRGYEGTPGRPPLKAWVAALPGIVAKHAEGLDPPELRSLAAGFGAKWQAVRSAAVARPFGDPAALSKASAALANWCGDFLAASSAVQTPVYTAEQSNRLLGMIAVAGGSQQWAADPEAAMHLTWAYVTLRNDLKRPIPDDKLDGLDAVVATRVRYPKDYSVTGEDKPQPVTAYLAPRLRKIDEYDSTRFLELFRSLRDK